MPSPSLLEPNLLSPARTEINIPFQMVQELGIEPDRRTFMKQLVNLQQDWEVYLQPRGSIGFPALIRMVVMYDSQLFKKVASLNSPLIPF